MFETRVIDGRLEGVDVWEVWERDERGEGGRHGENDAFRGAGDEAMSREK